MSKPNLAKVLYAAISLVLFEYVWVMALHSNDRVEYLKTSGIPARFALSVYFGTIAACVVCQALMAFIISASWVPARSKRLKLTALLLVGIVVAIWAGFMRKYGVWLPAVAYVSPQLLVLLAGRVPHPDLPVK